MNNINDQLKDINAIRHMMERSNKFISLSGLSGVIGGITALAGAALSQSQSAGHWRDTPFPNNPALQTPQTVI